MKILLISKEWFPKDSTGLGISAKTHMEIFKKKGHEVKTISKNNKSLTDFQINFYNLFHFLINYFYFRNKAKSIINDYNPDLIVIESLQTVISELFLSLKYKKKTRVILLSHGISILPYKWNFKYLLRFLIYLFYLPLVYLFLKKVDIFYSLNLTNKSNRHLDEKVYKLSKKNGKIIKYFNTSRFEDNQKVYREQKNKIISCFGYIGEIKNQKNFIKIAEYFKNEKIIFRIIFQKFDENYLKSCKSICNRKELNNVHFINGNNIDIKSMIEESHLIVNTSITEVFPLSLVEGISMSIPFVSYNCGNISFLKGGLIAENYIEMQKHIELLMNNDFFYKKISQEGENFYKNNLSNNLLNKKFDEIYI